MGCFVNAVCTRVDMVVPISTHVEQRTADDHDDLAVDTNDGDDPDRKL